MIDIDALEALEKAATPGPWYSTSDGACCFKICTNDWKEHSREAGEWISSGSYDGDTGWAEKEFSNFSLIAAARNAIPSLIAELRAAREYIAASRETHFYEVSTKMVKALAAYDAVVKP